MAMSEDKGFRPRIGLPMYTSATQPGRWLSSASYVHAVTRAGGLAVPVPLLREPSVIEAWLQQLDGLLLCGGGDIAPERYGQVNQGLSMGIDEDRDAVELALARGATKRHLPTLGICRGAQLMNVAAGGSLIQDIPTQLPDALGHATPPTLPRDTLPHQVATVPGALGALGNSALSGAWDACTPLAVNSSHHQATAVPGTGLTVAATAPDGVVEALAGDAGWFRLGLQWHPEELLAPGHHPIHLLFFQSLVAAAILYHRTA
ncbi:MAG: gamma-glutamyl-gamma-aminobutyrate hydrolase family protein [Anaerolineae bacterium]|jgi:gamma-glutamyl-gamma-aminobutyrate hydrolase PuuD|nr:gamma-glutamyl-gamma-aminobutyrate hydrolase family protein [Chloroflexota bacterium]